MKSTGVGYQQEEIDKSMANYCAGDGGEEERLLKLLVSKFYGQATKGTRWMPWHFEAKKDVASCEKPR